MKKDTKKKDILVVDDESAVCNMLKKFLTKRGYDARTALSGEDAIKEMHKKKPDAVLLDIRMPGIDGVETLKRIKKIDKNIGVIMITVVREEDIGQKCMKLGAYDYIIKPFDLDYLEQALLLKLLAI